MRNGARRRRSRARRGKISTESTAAPTRAAAESGQRRAGVEGEGQEVAPLEVSSIQEYGEPAYQQEEEEAQGHAQERDGSLDECREIELDPARDDRELRDEGRRHRDHRDDEQR
jgi:hypothetical protein